MYNRRVLVSLILVLLLWAVAEFYDLSSFAQGGETITITTYYPAPFGVYKELRAKRMAIGDNYYDASGYAWGVNIDSDADLVVEGNVGIGTDNPQAKLDVDGDVHITGNLKVPSYICPGSGATPGGKAIYAANPNGAIGIYANTDATDGGAIDVAGNNCAINPGGVEATLGPNGRFQINRWTGSGYEILFNLKSNNDLYFGINGNVGIGTTNPGRILECKKGGGNPRADGWDIWSSREFKKDITYLCEEDYTQILAKLENIRVVRYHLKSEPKEAKLRLGLIAEEAPAEIISSDKKSTSLGDAIGFLMAVVKAQQREIQALKQKLINQ